MLDSCKKTQDFLSAQHRLPDSHTWLVSVYCICRHSVTVGIRLSEAVLKEYIRCGENEMSSMMSS